MDIPKQRAEIQSTIFADRLRYFVNRWGPTDLKDLYDFQMDLTNLMVDAMQSQTSYMSLGIETYASAIWREHSLRPLHVIMEEPKKGK